MSTFITNEYVTFVCTSLIFLSMWEKYFRNKLKQLICNTFLLTQYLTKYEMWLAILMLQMMGQDYNKLWYDVQMVSMSNLVGEEEHYSHSNIFGIQMVGFITFETVLHFLYKQVDTIYICYTDNLTQFYIWCTDWESKR